LGAPHYEVLGLPACRLGNRPTGAIGRPGRDWLSAMCEAGPSEVMSRLNLASFCSWMLDAAGRNGSQQYRLARMSSGAKGTKLAMSRVRVDWYSLTLLPVSLGLVVSMSFLTWWRATLLVFGAFVGRNCLHAGCYALSDLYRREFSKSDNARVLASSISGSRRSMVD